MPAGRPHKCPYCGSTTTASKGARKTKTMGIRRIRRCKDCRRKFTPKNQPAAQPEAREPVQLEIPKVVEAESPVPVEPESPNDEHHSPGL